MNATGKLWRIFAAAILLIAVQFASVTAEAHVGHSHGPGGHGVQAHGTAVAIAHTIFSAEAGSVRQAAQTQFNAQIQSAARAGTAAQSAPDALPSRAGTCVIGCCATGMCCCGAALAAASPDLPPKTCSLRIGFARLVSIQEADPQGLRKPPRSLV